MPTHVRVSAPRSVREEVDVMVAGMSGRARAIVEHADDILDALSPRFAEGRVVISPEEQGEDDAEAPVLSLMDVDGRDVPVLNVVRPGGETGIIELFSLGELQVLIALLVLGLEDLG